MKKLLILFLTLLAIGTIFQACDDTKTYAEMLDDEKNAVARFISDSAIHVISEEEFKAKGYTTNPDKNEYVSFTASGVYMRIINKGTVVNEGSVQKIDSFVDNDIVCIRYLEKNVDTRELTCFNVFLKEYADATQLYASPGVFRYVNNSSSYMAAGTFLEMDYYWASVYQSTVVPQGWLQVLPYIGNNAHIRLIVPSKMGHSSSQQYVTPYYYDIRELSKAKS